MDKKSFEQELSELLNRWSAENESNTPDYILADYLMLCLEAFNNTVNLRDEWHGRTLDCWLKEKGQEG